MTTGIDDRSLIVIVTTIFLGLQFVFHLVTKKSNKEVMDKMDVKFEKILERFDQRTAEIAKEIQSKREGYAGVVAKMLEGIQQTFHKVDTMESLQHQIADNLLKVSIVNKNTARIQERLEVKLTDHAIECKERNLELKQEHRDLGGAHV